MTNFIVTGPNGKTFVATSGGRWDAANLVRAKDKGLQSVDLADLAIQVSLDKVSGALELKYKSDGARYRVEYEAPG